MELTVQTLVVALAHGTGASTKASLLTRIQVALRLSATTVLDQHQLGGTHQASELAVVIDLDQHQLGETPLTQSVLAPDGAANHLAYKTPSLRRGCFICLPNTCAFRKLLSDRKKHLHPQIY
jgi:hypothetical protein